MPADVPASLREIVFSLPFALQSLNQRDRAHAVHFVGVHKSQDRMKLEVLAALGGTRYLPRPPFARARIMVVRCSAGQLDPDGLPATAKPLLDVLCCQSGVHPHGIGIIEDDSARHIELEVRQTGAMRGKGSTLVRIDELSGAVEPKRPRRRVVAGARVAG